MSSQFPQCPYSIPALLCYFLHKRINFKSAYQNTLLLANAGKCFKIFIKRSNQTQSVLLIKITKSASGFEVLQHAKFSAMGNQRKMHEKLPSTKQNIFIQASHSKFSDSCQRIFQERIRICDHYAYYFYSSPFPYLLLNADGEGQLPGKVLSSTPIPYRSLSIFKFVLYPLQVRVQ